MKNLTQFLNRCFLILFFKIAGTVTGNAQSVDSLNIFFDFDRTIPRSNYFKSIQDFLSDKVPDSIFIVGYADTAGSPQYNFKLSQRRAEWARQRVMETFGVNERIRLIAGGETEESTLVERNRRATILVYYQKLQPDTAAVFTKLDTSFTLDQIYFQPDKAFLTPESEQMMPMLLKRMERYKSDSIEIRGHVNQAGAELPPTDPLFKLSEQRARLIYQFFVNYGYDPMRLSFRGMGNSQTKSTERLTDAEQRRNMRVELVIYKHSQD